VFVEEARRTLMQADLTREVTLRTAKWGAHTLNVSFIGPAMFRLLPPILALHKARYPDIQIKLSSLSSPEQIIGIMEGRVDVGFLHPSVDLMEGGDRMIVEKCDIVAAIPENWELARKEVLSLADLAAHPLIMVPEKESPTRAASLKSAFRSVGAQPNIVQEAMQTQTTLSLVAGGLGAALVMETAALTGMKGIAYRRVVDLPSNMRWEIAMTWYANHKSKSANNFMNVVRGYCSENTHLDKPIIV
jgi:DNA-binding transcriptional LysR family regulator